MSPQFSNRIGKTPSSFIREIFKYLEIEGMISFSGGFPNPESFPIAELSDAAKEVLDTEGKHILQYSGTQGYAPLREWISARYLERFELKVDPSEILIVNGSQQALDLIAKVFINEGDGILMENPAYLGAIQSFSLFEPSFFHATLHEDGIDVDEVDRYLSTEKIKLMYTVPNFQNPSGITYSKENREALAKVIKKHDVILIEDDPYGELRFMGESQKPIKTYAYDQVIMMGSFSKIISPGLRLGWVTAPKGIIEKLVIAKQASDLHSNALSQYLIYDFLSKHNVNTQIQKILDMYRIRREAMVDALELYLPKDCSYTKPEGGMFLWVTLPQGLTSMGLFQRAVDKKVVFVPGDPFYTSGENHPSLRLNYTNSDPKEITEGIKRLAEAIEEERSA